MRRFLGIVIWLAGASLVQAGVQVGFSHSYTGPGAVTQNTGDITLSFSVDGSGNVTLNATCADPDPLAYVNEFSSVGMVSNGALWGGGFSIVLSGVGNMRIDNGGYGLSIQGGNAQKIDWSNEGINASVNVPDGKLKLSSISYENASTSSGTLLDVNDISYVLSGGNGTVNISEEGSFTVSSASDADGQGFVLSGFSFNVVSTINENMEIGTDLTDEVVVMMEGSSTNFAFTGTSNGTLVVGSAATFLTLPDAGGTSPVELGGAALSLETGSQWILDGSMYSNTFAVGDRFVLANYGSFSGGTWGVRYRNFNLPADRDLQLVNTSFSLYFEVVAQTPAIGPNIIIVNVDDMVGGQHFNFEGRDCLTPTLDTLATTGIHFTEAFAASTVCGPSRYALMSGRYASRNTSSNFLSKYPLGTVGRFGVSDTELEDDGENLGTWLQRAGYRTGFVGKAHLIDDHLNNTANWPSADMVTYSSSADPAVDAEVNGAMHHNHRVLAQRMRPYGFDYASGFYRANLKELANDYLNVHNQEWITKNALDFIEENHSQRFFLYMAPTINHGPVRNDLSKSLRADSHYTSAGFFEDLDYSFMPSRQSIVDEVTAANKDLISARETWVDYSIAAITNKLAEYGIENDTLIIFTADHGEKTFDSPAIWCKSSLFDTGMRVPLVMHWPAGIVSPGRVYDEDVSHIDFVPTLLELAGATNLPSRVLDGKSLVPVLNGSSASLHDDVFCEIGYARGVRSKDWKYIAVRYKPSVYAQINSGYLWKNYKTGLHTEPRPYYVNNSSLGYLSQNVHPSYYDDDQLYDLASDPMEQTNLYGQLPAIAYDLKKRLAGYMGDMPDRPFREFDDASTEFSPAPAGAPTAPGSLQMQFQGLENIQLDWSDAANSELGYIVEQSTNGAPFEVVGELPSGSNSATVEMDSGIEDIVLRVSSYNVLGDSAAASEVDLLAPESWRYRTFGSITSSNSQWSVDADGDGTANIWEYAFATDPLDSNSTDWITGDVIDTGTNRWLEITVPRDSRRTVSIEGRTSTNLTDWVVGAPDSVMAEEAADYLVIRSTTPAESEPAQFLGAEVVIP
jgi:arylsulfatase A-like enzyme